MAFGFSDAIAAVGLIKSLLWRSKELPVSIVSRVVTLTSAPISVSIRRIWSPFEIKCVVEVLVCEVWLAINVAREIRDMQMVAA